MPDAQISPSLLSLLGGAMYRLPLSSSQGAMELLWLPMGRQWAPSDSPWTPFAPLWDNLGCPLAPFGSLWGALGSLVADSWNFLKCGSHFPEKLAKIFDFCGKSSPAGILPTYPPDPLDPPDLVHDPRLGTTLPRAPGVRMT